MDFEFEFEMGTVLALVKGGEGTLMVSYGPSFLEMCFLTQKFFF